MFTDYPISATPINLSQSLPWLLIERQRHLIRLGADKRAYPTAHFVSRRFATRAGAESAMVKATMREERDIRRGRIKLKYPRTRYIAKATTHIDFPHTPWSKVAMLFNSID